MFSTGKIPTGADFAELIDGVQGDAGKDGADGSPNEESWNALLDRVRQMEEQINEVEKELDPQKEEEYGDTPVSVTIDQGDVVTFMEPGVLKQLTITIDPTDAEQEVIWSTSDESIARPDSTGFVRAINEGTCTITVESVVDSDIKDTIEAVVSGY